MARVVVEQVPMPLPDGTALATDVAYPDDGERHPVLLVRTPYDRLTLRAAHDPIALARAGWAVVLQDVRGRWASEGTFDPILQEPADGAAAVEWCASRPWSNGRVAMAGASYNGFTQWSAAFRRPEALKAIAPTLTTPFVGSTWFREGGAFRIGVWSIWSLALGSGGSHGTRATERRAAKNLERWRELVRPPVAVDEIAAGLPAFRDWVAGGDGLAAVEPKPTLPTVDVPAFHVAGWYDIFCEGSLAAYAALAKRGKAAQRLIVGPWSHATMLLRLVGQVDFGPKAVGPDGGVLAEQLRFLRDAVDGREPRGGATVFVMGANRWIELDAWPPPADPLELFLAADGRLARERGPSGADRYRHDPADPVPTLGGRHLLWGMPAAGPIDQRPVEERDDVLVYTSEPLRRSVTVVGEVEARLRVASSAARTDFAVKLVDVHPDGTALNVVDSIRRVELEPGRAKTIRVGAGSTAMTFRRGHRIRVEVASANFPHFDCLGPAEQTVHHGSSLRLPVIPA